MQRQVESGGETWTGRVDFRHVAKPLIIEVQSEMYHDALIDRVADRIRIAALRDAGFEVVELTDVQVWNRPWEVGPLVSSALRRLDARSVGHSRCETGANTPTTHHKTIGQPYRSTSRRMMRVELSNTPAPGFHVDSRRSRDATSGQASRTT
ncbi:hypothetical protein BH10ACT3_BH10ACT3_16390 [soil metagenome]